uniref:Ubiquitin-like protease family profile domain-containing protein n=1 Tax=Arundo donax TaxID=35708 RepID=A0A0A9DRK5_ARUDO
MAHWSLIIICIPAKESNSGPIILHLDSLGMHPSSKIFNTVEKYLEAEWCHLKKNPPPDTSISESIWKDLPRNIHTEKVQVPQQNNAYDCGIFMLYYIKRFIREAPERLTRDKLDMFSCSWFNSEDASELRLTIRALLLEEFESARLDDAMLDAATSDGSDIEDCMSGGELEAVTTSEMIVEGLEFGDTGKNNEGLNVTASEERSGESGEAGKSNEGLKGRHQGCSIGRSKWRVWRRW